MVLGEIRYTLCGFRIKMRVSMMDSNSTVKIPGFSVALCTVFILRQLGSITINANTIFNLKGLAVILS